MDDPLILTFDVGTQSLRGMIVDTNGAILAFYKSQYETPYLSPEPGWAEQTPNFYFDRLCESSRALKKSHGDLFPRIIGVTIACMRDTMICLDARNQPLRNIILWLDSRRATYRNDFKPLISAAFSIVGMKETAINQFETSPCNWIKQHEPDIWAKTAKYVMLSTFLHYKLTGILADCPANIIGHLPFNYKKRTWMSKHALTRGVFDVPRDKLFDIIPAGEIIGSITAEAAQRSEIPQGLPLIASGSDKGCETLGLSVIHPHKAALSFGTTATIQFAASRYFEPQQFLPAYPAVCPDLYNPEIEIYRGFWLVSWFIREFARKEYDAAKKQGCSPESLLDGCLADVPPGCDGLALQPFWTPGLKQPKARGAVIGFSDVHTRSHFYRAIVEGIGFALLEGMKSMERRSGQIISELFVAGGGAQSDMVCQITADIFGLPIRRIQTHEVSGLGASLSAFVSMKIFDSYEKAIEKMTHIEKTFQPDDKNHAVYERVFNDVYGRMYPRLRPIYQKIDENGKKR